MLTRISSHFRSIAARGLIAAAMALCAAAATSQPQPVPQSMTVEVIQLRYRTSQELIPVIQPMLAPGGGISGLQGQLVVRSTPANLEEIKRILASVDTAPRQLLITVRQDADISSERSAASVSGSVGGERGRASVPGSRDTRGGNAVLREGDDRVRVHIIEGRSNENSSNTQSVRAMEGREAYVSVGQSIPVRGRQVRRVVVNGQVVEQVVDSTQYRDLSTGFYVLPRVSGDRVTLDISPQREALSRQVAGGVSVQSMVTTVSGRIGEWIEIGGVAQDAAGQQSVLFGAGAASTRDIRRIQVKVDDVQ